VEEAPASIAPPIAASPSRTEPPSIPHRPEAAPRTSVAPFEHLSVEAQVDELKRLADRKGYPLSSLKTKGGAPVALADFSPAQRLKFHYHLNGLPDVAPTTARGGQR
jgi:hypothetical protein